MVRGLGVRAEGGDNVLSGTIPDQAALHGVLAKVRDLGLPSWPCPASTPTRQAKGRYHDLHRLEGTLWTIRPCRPPLDGARLPDLTRNPVVITSTLLSGLIAIDPAYRSGPPPLPSRVAELPTETVTFLFPDIEGSTRLLQELGDR